DDVGAADQRPGRSVDVELAEGALGPHPQGQLGDLDALKLAMPGLVLAHNLHGVDIDPRCAQIAQLALWMRAQRAFREFDIDRAARPLIRRSNIVIAEPMPGEEHLRDEFLRELKEDRLEGLMRRAMGLGADHHVHTNKAMADSLAALVNAIWDEMALAGDMGVLLKIERILARRIEKARAEWEGGMPLFPIAEFGIAGGNAVSESEGTSRSGRGGRLDFWGRAELLVFKALEEYAAGGAGFARRRMFVEDSFHGFALADLVSKRFDVVLMNPPFGSSTLKAKPAIDRWYPVSKQNLFACFVERSAEMLARSGMIGIISPRTGFFLSDFTSWREGIVFGSLKLKSYADLGIGVLDSAMVEACAYCLEGGQ
ncbi:MAG: hypothetical protein EON58_14010, partial [Alphaproteobacteria bacterium]